jgi:hypothetical protein
MASLKDFLRDGLSGNCDNVYQYDPFIKGTFFAFIEIPNSIDLGDFQDVFARTALAVTLPNPTIAELEAIGQGGLRTMHPGALSLGNDLPVRLRDTYELKVVKGISKWFNTIRSMRTGLSQIELRSSRYKGILKLILTSPSGKYSPLALKFIGVWPNSDPLQALGTDINDISIAEVDVTFKFDRICPMDETEAKKLIDELETVETLDI